MTSSLVLLVSLAVAAQYAVLWGMGRRKPIGDEAIYLERGTSDDPYSPRLFLRPPFLPWLARRTFLAGNREGQRPEHRLRFVMAFFSSVTVILVAVAAWRIGGVGVAIFAVIVTAAHPERLILGCHLWPDTLLAALLAAILLIQTFPPTLVVAGALGAVCALGALCRIDWMLVVPCVLAAWPGSLWSSHSSLSLILIGAPAALSLIVLSFFNFRRYGIFLPDTTWAFNLMVADSEIRSWRPGTFAIQGTVGGVLKSWKQSPDERFANGVAAAWRLTGSPVRALGALIRRALSLLGPDTFIRQRLLNNSVYPDLGRSGLKIWNAFLVAAFPLLVSLLFFVTAVRPSNPPLYSWPAAGLAAAIIAVHTRTRYRVALIPTLSVVLADRTSTLWREPPEALHLVVATIIGAVLFVLLASIQPSHEKGPGRPGT